jgi:hypothetical protein
MCHSRRHGNIHLLRNDNPSVSDGRLARGVNVGNQSVPTPGDDLSAADSRMWCPSLAGAATLKPSGRKLTDLGWKWPQPRYALVSWFIPPPYGLSRRQGRVRLSWRHNSRLRL